MTTVGFVMVYAVKKKDKRTHLQKHFCGSLLETFVIVRKARETGLLIAVFSGRFTNRCC